MSCNIFGKYLQDAADNLNKKIAKHSELKNAVDVICDRLNVCIAENKRRNKRFSLVYRDAAFSVLPCVDEDGNVHFQVHLHYIADRDRSFCLFYLFPHEGSFCGLTFEDWEMRKKDQDDNLEPIFSSNEELFKFLAKRLLDPDSTIRDLFWA